MSKPTRLWYVYAREADRIILAGFASLITAHEHLDALKALPTRSRQSAGITVYPVTEQEARRALDTAFGLPVEMAQNVGVHA